MIRLLFYLIPIIIAVIIFFDLRKIGRSSIAFLVATACAFLFPVGPLIYLGVRSKLRLSTVSMPSSFCSRCGYNDVSNHKQCPKCGNELVI